MISKKKSGKKHSSKNVKSSSSSKKLKTPSRKAPTKHSSVVPSKKGKKHSIDHEKLLEEIHKDEDDWEDDGEHQKKKRSSDDIRWEDLEGFDFDDDAYSEPEEKGGGVQVEEVFDEEP